MPAPDGPTLPSTGIHAEGTEIELVWWPAEAGRRAQLAAHQIPRLLVVDQGSSTPENSDCLEDWIRLPAPQSDLQARLDALAARRRVHLGGIPHIDGDDVVRFGAGCAALPPIEARLAGTLIARFGAVVGRDTLYRSMWPKAPPAAHNALNVHVLRLRRRLAPLGLAIRTVRSRGYVMEVEVDRRLAPLVGPGSRPLGHPE